MAWCIYYKWHRVIPACVEGFRALSIRDTCIPDGHASWSGCAWFYWSIPVGWRVCYFSDRRRPLSFEVMAFGVVETVHRVLILHNQSFSACSCPLLVPRKDCASLWVLGKRRLQWSKSRRDCVVSSHSHPFSFVLSFFQRMPAFSLFIVFIIALIAEDVANASFFVIEQSLAGPGIL